MSGRPTAAVDRGEARADRLGGIPSPRAARWLTAILRAHVLPLLPGPALVEAAIWRGWAAADADPLRRVVLDRAAELASLNAHAPLPDGAWTLEDAAAQAGDSALPGLARAVELAMAHGALEPDPPAHGPGSLWWADVFAAALLDDPASAGLTGWLDRWADGQRVAGAHRLADAPAFRWALYAGAADVALATEDERAFRHAVLPILTCLRASQVASITRMADTIRFENLRDTGAAAAEPAGLAWPGARMLSSPDLPVIGSSGAPTACALSVPAMAVCWDHLPGVEAALMAYRRAAGGRASLRDDVPAPAVVVRLLDPPVRPNPFRGQVFVLGATPAVVPIPRLPILG